MVFAQVKISLLNTVFTAIFLLGVLPLFGVHLPLSKTLVLITFVAGLLPVVGNIISNTIITIVALSVSFYVAVAALLYLIVIHSWSTSSMRASSAVKSRPAPGAAAGHAGDGGGVRPARPGGGAGVLCLREARTGRPALDLTRRNLSHLIGWRRAPALSARSRALRYIPSRMGRHWLGAAGAGRYSEPHFREFCMAGKVSPIRLRTWVWILAGLFVVCTLPLMAIALVQGTLRYTDAEGNLASLRQLRQTFDLANLASAERPGQQPAGADPADAAEQARLAAQLAVARQRVDTALLQLETVFKDDPGVYDEHRLLASAQRRLKSARAAVDHVAAQPHDARRVEEVGVRSAACSRWLIACIC